MNTQICIHTKKHEDLKQNIFISELRQKSGREKRRRDARGSNIPDDLTAPRKVIMIVITMIMVMIIIIDYVSNPKHGHPKGRSGARRGTAEHGGARRGTAGHGVARWRGGAEQDGGTAERCTQGTPSITMSRSAKSCFLEVSSEARTNEIVCEPNGGTRRAVDN